MESYFKKLAGESLERVINSYILQLFTKRHTLDSYTVDRITEDEIILRECFTKYCKKSVVEKNLQILNDLRDLLDAEPDMIGLYFHSLLKNNPDVTITIMEALLSMRYDLDKNQIAQAIEGCNNILAQRGPVENIEHGVFSRLKLPSKLNQIFGSRR